MLNTSYIGLRFTLFFISLFFPNVAVQGMYLNTEGGEEAYYHQRRVYDREPEEESRVSVHIDSFLGTINDIQTFISSNYAFNKAEVELPILTLYLPGERAVSIGPEGGRFYLSNAVLPLTLIGKLHSSITLFPSGEKIHFSKDVMGVIPSDQNEVVTELHWDPVASKYGF